MPSGYFGKACCWFALAPLLCAVLVRLALRSSGWARVQIAVGLMGWRERPEASAGLLRCLTFRWIQPMFARAAQLRRHNGWLELENLALINLSDRSNAVERAFEEAWEGSSGVGGGGDDNAARTAELERRITRSLLTTCRGHVIRGGFLRLVNSVLQFFLSLLLNSMLSYFRRVQSGEVAEGDGAWAYYRGY